MEPVRVLPFGKFESAASGTQYNTDPTARINVQCFGAKPCIRQRLSCSADGKTCRSRYMLPLFQGEAFERIDVADLAGDLDGDFGSIKRFDAANTTL